MIQPQPQPAPARERIEGALQELRPEQRGVLLPRKPAGCSWKGIALELGQPSPNASIEHEARARAALAALLARRLPHRDR